MRQINDEWQGAPALATGRYSNYLPNYLEVFGDSEIRIFKFDTLKKRPKWIVDGICKQVDIDSSFYNNYNFAVHNPSSSVRYYPVHRLYLRIGQRFSHQNYPEHPGLQRMLVTLRRRWERLYNPINLKQESNFAISQEIRSLLQEYYRNEQSALAKILHVQEFTWQDN